MQNFDWLARSCYFWGAGEEAVLGFEGVLSIQE